MMPNERRKQTRRPIRVLIVDDSPLVRRILTEILSRAPDLEVAGTAPDPYVARDLILALKPDVLTLDIEMPRMDGLTFLKKLMRYHPLPVVIISSAAGSGCTLAMEALRLGAVDVLEKPNGPSSIGALSESLPRIVHAAGVSKLRKDGGWPAPAIKLPDAVPMTPRASGGPGANQLLAFGASTGGTAAIAQILELMPADSPPMVVVQHIPAGFSRAFAERLNQTCKITVREAADGEIVRPGTALIAPGNLHMLVRRRGGALAVEVKDGPLICYQRPSVDILFSSVAESAGGGAMGVILTGMGSDGAKGLRKMRDAGAQTIAQDESSSVVFGMPREAIRLGAASEVLPLGEISRRLLAGI